MDYSQEFDFGTAYFDSRDVIGRIDYLEDEIDEDGNSTLDEEEKQELADLQAFAAECEGYVADWKYGEQFIADYHFEDYAREFAEDIGAIDRDADWPNTYIDWPAATEALQQDYSSFTLRGTEYWAR